MRLRAERGLVAFEASDHRMRGDSCLMTSLWPAGPSGDVMPKSTIRVATLLRIAEPERYQRLKRWTTESGTWGEHERRAIALLEERGGERRAVANRPTPINRNVAARIPALATHDDLVAVLAWEAVSTTRKRRRRARRRCRSDGAGRERDRPPTRRRPLTPETSRPRSTVRRPGPTSAVDQVAQDPHALRAGR
jgi:hypothetical protein